MVHDWNRFRVSAFQFSDYEGSRILECVCFTVNPLESLEDITAWIEQLNFVPDHIEINVHQGGCLFDNEDTRILNNTFYCNKYA